MAVRRFLSIALISLVAGTTPAWTSASAHVQDTGWSPVRGFVAAQIAEMTTPSSPVFDRYLAARLRGHTIGSLQGVSTLNPQLQSAAQQTVTSQIRALGPEHVTDGALVSIDLRPSCYGCILAMVGSASVDRRTALIDMANVPRQPGSSFLPFAYLAGFERGLAPGKTVLDAPLQIRDRFGGYTPMNHDHTYHGQITLRTALGNSYEIPAVKIGIWTTPRAVGEVAFRLGMADFWKDNPHCCSYAAAIGGLERGVRLVQETAAYGAIATGGMSVFPISFARIRDQGTGRVLWQASRDTFLVNERRRVAPAVDAYMVTDVLSDNAARAHSFGQNSPLLLSRPAAAQTGTANQLTDNWTEGYVPQLVTGVWAGNGDNSPMVGITGVTGAVPIWHTFMQRAFQVLRLPVQSFRRPSGVQRGTRCRLANTGRLSYGSVPLDLYPAGAMPYCTVPRVRGVD
jgi:membrane peptidoglycan carboxypeptidase